MEEQKSLLTNYEPLDFNTIKPSKIHTERELDNESSHLSETLKDISILGFLIYRG